MKKSIFVLVCIMLPCVAWAGDTTDDWNQPNTFLKPYKSNAYGPSINSDATGRPFQWKTQDGETIMPHNKVKKDAYGLGISMDEYGRPVKPSQWGIE